LPAGELYAPSPLRKQSACIVVHMRAFEHVIGDVCHACDRFITAIEFNFPLSIVHGLESENEHRSLPRKQDRWSYRPDFNCRSCAALAGL